MNKKLIGIVIVIVIIFFVLLTVSGFTGGLIEGLSG